MFIEVARLGRIIGLSFGVLLFVSACSPEVGSEEWCKDMKDQPSGDWTANEAADFAKHCVF